MGSTLSAGRQQIGINAHLLSGQDSYRRAGIHHYISRLLQGLRQAMGDFRLTVFANNTRDLVGWPAGAIVTTRWPTANPLIRIMWEQVAWPWYAARHQLDLLHSMAFVTPLNNPCPIVVTVYDLSFIHHPDHFPPLKRSYLTRQTKRSCRTARRIVAISESGRRDIHELFGVPLERIDVVPPGVDATFRLINEAEVEAFRRRERLPKRFFLHVGTLQPRKNIPLLIEAFAQMPRQDVGLVLVGGEGWSFDQIYRRVEEMDLRDRIRFAGYVPDLDLPLWYNAAAALVFPSVYEGFGMPVSQAMACGTPVIAAKTSAVPEAAGEAALYFDPQDVSALAEHMVTVLDDSGTRATMRQVGLNQARKYSWQEAGEKMITIYQRALAEL